MVELDLTERALILADTVSYELWGGSRGWERATEEQFTSLAKRLKEKLRANTNERVATIQRDDRVPRERVSPDSRNSQPVDHHDLDEAP